MFILWAKKHAYDTKKRQDRGKDPWVDPQRGGQHLHYDGIKRTMLAEAHEPLAEPRTYLISSCGTRLGKRWPTSAEIKSRVVIWRCFWNCVTSITYCLPFLQQVRVTMLISVTIYALSWLGHVLNYWRSKGPSLDFCDLLLLLGTSQGKAPHSHTRGIAD